jgi:hypothetical protein
VEDGVDVEAGFLVKISVARVVNGQIAGAGDLAALLGGDDVNASFASFLDLVGSGRTVADQIQENRGGQGTRSRQRESNEGSPQASRDLRPNAISNALSPQPLPSVSNAPWQLDSGDSRKAESVENESDKTPLSAAMSDNLPIGAHLASVNASPTNAPAPQPILDEDAAEMTPAKGLSDPGPVEPSIGNVVKNQDARVNEAAPAPNDKSMALAFARSSSVAPIVVGPSTAFPYLSVPTGVRQGGANPKLVGIPVVEGDSSASSHAVKSGEGGQEPGIGASAPSIEPPAQDGGQQVKSAASSQGVVDAASSSPGGGHSQGGGSDAHRSPSDQKESIVINHVPAPQGSNVGVFNPGDSAHGHSAPTDSSHPEASRESAANTQLKDPASPRAADVGAARLLGSVMRSDIRVGVQTEAFGRVTIQTNAQGGQLSAQVLLENAKESATLAAHLPGVEEKIVQQHGLNASVRLVGGLDGGAGAGSMGRDQSGSGRRDPERYDNDVVMRPPNTRHESSNRAVEPALLGSRYTVSSTLDVTV